jgi:hypothetical protein
MKIKLAATILAAAAALVIGAGPVSADQPRYGCFAQGGSLLFSVDGSPGSAEWLDDFRDCRAVDKVGTHVAPILP